MGRILFFLLLGVAAYVAFRVWRTGPRRDTAAGNPAKDASESMVRCAHCNLNLPRSEALAESGRWYCSEAHRQLGRDGA